MERTGYFCSLATIYQTKRCQDTEYQSRNFHSHKKFKSYKPQKPHFRHQNFLDCFGMFNGVNSWQSYIIPNGVTMQNTKIGIFKAVRNSNLINLRNHTADITIWLFWNFQLCVLLQRIHLIILTNAHNMLNVHLVVIKIRNWSEFSVYPVLLLLVWHVYTRLLKLRMFDTVLSPCPFKFSYLNFIIVLHTLR